MPVPHGGAGDAAGPDQRGRHAADRGRAAPAHPQRQLPGHVHPDERRLLQPAGPERRPVLQRVLRCHQVSGLGCQCVIRQ